MFELISRGARHPFHDRAVVPTLVSVVLHGVVLTAVLVLPLLYVTDRLPDVPTMMAFVTAAPVVPPLPPPPPPPPAASRGALPKPASVPTINKWAAPVEAPSEIGPEPPSVATEAVRGVEGGVEGGIPGGVVGGIVGGLISAVPPPPPPPPAPPPPPPPPPPPRPTPVRIGGQLTAPTLLYRVDPTYPNIAVAAKVSGMVILEAQVGEDGCVESVRVLRSLRMLDQAAIDAVMQWRYSPLVLNGVPTPFVLTVMLNFRANQ